MRADDPNLASLELAALALGPLLDELVLVGGCATGLLITDPSVPPVRATLDVDLLTEVTPLSSYYALQERLRQRGFVLVFSLRLTRLLLPGRRVCGERLRFWEPRSR